MDSEKIKKDLVSENPEDRLYAVQDIISFKLDSLVPDIIKQLHKEEDRLVKELMVESLKFFDVSKNYDDIAAFFESTDAFIRNCSIEIFGSKGEEAVAFLTSVMDHSDKEVRKLVLDSLVATGSKYCIPALQAGLNDPAPNVKITAIEYLGRIEDKASKEKILEIFKDFEEPMLRISCIETLMNLGDSDTLDEVLMALGGTNMDSFYKPSVFRMVSLLGAQRHCSFLYEFFNNRNTLFLMELGNALLKIINRSGKTDIPDKVIKFIVNNLQDSAHNSEERMTFLNILCNSDYTEKEDILTELTGDKDINIMLSAFENLAELDKDKALRQINMRKKVADSEVADALDNLLEYLSES